MTNQKTNQVQTIKTLTSIEQGAVSKLTFESVPALLKAYPTETIKDLLSKHEPIQVVEMITNQNKTNHLIAGALRDEASFELLGKLAQGVEHHVMHIKDYGVSANAIEDTRTAKAPRIEDYDNFLRFLIDVRNFVKVETPDSDLNCQYTFSAMLREKYPLEVALLTATNEGKEVNPVYYTDLVNQPRFSGVLAKTRCTELSNTIPQKVEALRERYGINKQQFNLYKSMHGTGAGDFVLRDFQPYINDLIRILAITCIQSDSVLTDLAGITHKNELAAVMSLASALKVHQGYHALDYAVVSLNCSKVLYQKAELERQALAVQIAEKQRLEDEARKEAEQAELEASFADELKREQRLIVLTAKVQKGDISIAEFHEYKQLKSA
ncbi:hypothetical protein OCT63_13920 [Vibrio sp. RW]|uniref:hypothetical protein n=1 Tax=Vibrio sp. RW TaxID=2998833 RepID=UPI0022CD4AEE|nr:hypothetical protein [Vibrio sp. RW]MDA0145317.1 hypothetical protein [Vibrio sp. RW]